MGDRACEFDVTHALATYFSKRHFDATFLTNHAAMLKPFILATQALIVLVWSKNLGAEQTVALWFERTVVDGFRLLHFAELPGPNQLWRCQTNSQ